MNLPYCTIFTRSFDGGTPVFYPFFLKKVKIFGSFWKVGPIFQFESWFSKESGEKKRRKNYPLKNTDKKLCIVKTSKIVKISKIILVVKNKNFEES